MQERAKKVDELRSLGIEPYARRFIENTDSESLRLANQQSELPEWEAIQLQPQDAVCLAGRLMTFREHGRIAFGTLQDNKGRIQVCFLRDFTKIAGLDPRDMQEHERVWKKLFDLGDHLGVVGDLFRTKHGELTILAHEISFLAKALRPMPEKWHGLADQEACYRQRNLDLISNPETRTRFHLRSAVVREIREFFYAKGFEEIETRVLQAQAGGAMAKVFETHHNALDHDFVLRIALELELKIALSGGFDRVFEIGKCFRNEGSDPSHLQEFTMLEWYAAYADLDTNRSWTEELIRSVLMRALGKTRVTVMDKEGLPHEIDFAAEFATERFPELLKKHAGIDMFTISDAELASKAQVLAIEDTHKKGRATLLDDIYKKTARPKLIQPTFVFDYPEQLKPLARPKGDGTAECFQLLIAGWEVVNSYGELIDPAVQRRLFEEQMQAKAAGDDEAMELDEDFLRAMEHGFPPMTGSGIGIDRLIALISGQQNLRDVVFFPTMKPEQGKIQESGLKIQESVQNLATMKKQEGVRGGTAIPDDRDFKFVAVLNKKIEQNKLFNALGHMAAGVSGGYDSEKFFLEYRDADDGIHPSISHFPFIVLRADNANQLRNLRKQAQELGIEYTDFTDTMTIGTSKAQLEATKTKREEELEYFGVCLFGSAATIDPLTKKFSLWK